MARGCRRCGEGTVVMATISLVGSASRRFVSRGGVGLRQGFAILSSVA